MQARTKNVVVLGAGLVGSLLSVVLARRGIEVAVYDKRADLRKSAPKSRRTINLALSERGWRALKAVGIADQVNQLSIPLRGRMIHHQDGGLSIQPYGKEGQSIYSISREKLNATLIDCAQSTYRVPFHFEHQCTEVNLEGPRVVLDCPATNQKIVLTPDVLIGADGAFSKVRESMLRHHTHRFNYQQHYIEHGYKELAIPADAHGNWRLQKNYLHIWPRGKFMFIALPNLDGSFTGTLFFPFEGEISFAAIKHQNDVLQLFKSYFKDALPLMPDVAEEYFSNYTSPLVTVNCFPWCYRDKAMLIGDAAHAILPFYGQGMNTGFEDCMQLDELMADFGGDWETLFDRFQQSRKANTDAIAELALQNFTEMREKTVDPVYLLRKDIELHLTATYPDLWTPLYSMVSFSNIPFAEVLEISRRQEQLMDKIMAMEGVEKGWKAMNFRPLLHAGRER